MIIEEEDIIGIEDRIQGLHLQEDAETEDHLREVEAIGKSRIPIANPNRQLLVNNRKTVAQVDEVGKTQCQDQDLVVMNLEDPKDLIAGGQMVMSVVDHQNHFENTNVAEADQGLVTEMMTNVVPVLTLRTKKTAMVKAGTTNLKTLEV